MIFGFFSFISIFFETGRNSQSVIIEIRHGAVASEVSNSLFENKIIRNRIIFSLAVKSLGLEDKIQAGSYDFDKYSTLFDVLLKLKNAKIREIAPVEVVFPEGVSIYKMGSILEKNKVKCFEEFRGLTETNLVKAKARDFFFLRLVNSDSFEGVLFPDTYIFNTDISFAALADLMLKRFNQVIWVYWQENRKKAKLSFYQTLILASIIEKEAAIDSERPVISSVFYNRLKMGMALAADPTIKYVLADPTKKVYIKQLKIDSPYNTYKYKGLPPSPICNPGLSSFKAAMFPSETNYIYFVARKDGSHIFSTSWRGHQKARLLAR